MTKVRLRPNLRWLRSYLGKTAQAVKWSWREHSLFIWYCQEIEQVIGSTKPCAVLPVIRNHVVVVCDYRIESNRMLLLFWNWRLRAGRRHYGIANLTNQNKYKITAHNTLTWSALTIWRNFNIFCQPPNFLFNATLTVS